MISLSDSFPSLLSFRSLPALSLLLLPAFACVARAQNAPTYEQAPINYSAASPHDAVTRLRDRIAAGGVTLAQNDREALLAILRELQVPIESQVVVFSKTSLQRGRIGPQNPRALYFSDSCYVGWVPGGLIEIADIDPQLGPVFYSFDPRTSAGTERTITRDSDCLRCHGGTFVRDIPGVFARSLVPSTTGEPLLRHGSVVVDDQTPFEQRWGGWYVTGYTGKLNHRGNALGTETENSLTFDLSEERPMELTQFFDVSKYPATTSDVVALLVLEHQMDVQNSLTQAGQSARRMLDYQRSLQKAFGEPFTDEPAYDSVKSVFNSSVQDVVDHLLFRGAAPLPAGVTGSRGFQDVFARAAPRTRDGRSLKDFQLRDRLFAFRCSFLIYSETFTALPAQLKNRIFDRLQQALTDDSPDARYAYLDHDERRKIRDILLETHPDARARWTKSLSASAPDAEERPTEHTEYAEKTTLLSAGTIQLKGES